MAFRNQSVQGTLVSNMADVDETLEFARRGTVSVRVFLVGFC